MIIIYTGVDGSKNLPTFKGQDATFSNKYQCKQNRYLIAVVVGRQGPGPGSRVGWRELHRKQQSLLQEPSMNSENRWINWAI